MAAKSLNVYCFVPGCSNTKRTTPDKLFFNVPKGSERTKWTKVVRRDPMSEKTPTWCCEDHFTLEQDVENWVSYSVMKDAGQKPFPLRLKKDILPHIFNCQPDRRICQEKPPRSAVLKRENRSVLKEILSDNSSVNKESSISVNLTGPATLSTDNHHDSVEVNTSSTEKRVDEEISVDLVSEPSIASSNNLEGTIEGEPSSSHPTETLPIADSFSSPEKTYRDFSCQVRPRFRSKGTQIGTSVASCGVNTSPVKFRKSIGTNNSIECEAELSVSTSADPHDNDPSYRPNESVVTDGSFVSDELDSFIKTEHVTGILSLVESNPKSFIGIDPHHMFVISALENFGNLHRANIFMCLWKIRKNETEDCLALFFGKHKSHVSRIFAHDIPIIAHLLKTYIIWPERNIIQSNVPLAFRANFSKVESIIDCFEVQIEKPSDPAHQANTWSDYKQCNTMKFLISCTPNGLINFISDAYGGRTSDTKIVMQSGYLDKLKENTHVMADRGFKLIETELNKRKCVLIRPPSVATGSKMSEAEVRLTKQIASLRIHVERVIRRIREFEFLGPHACFHHNLLAYIDQAAIIACALANLQSPIVH